MRNILLILAMIIAIPAVIAASETVHVSAEESFSTANPAQKIDVCVVDNATLGSNLLKAGDVIHCDVVKVTAPKRGKRAATFAVCPTSYTSDGDTKIIQENYYGKYASKVISKKELKNVDAKKVGKKAAVSVGNYFVKGIAPAISLAEGMVKNEDGNRIESGIKQVYKDSPLSYASKGQELEITSGQQFYLIFKPAQSKNASDIENEVLEEEIK